MTFWEGRAADAANLRLYIPGQGWRTYNDRLSADGHTVEQQGAKALIESLFLNVLNATNLALLTGSGASFAAQNNSPKPNAPGMWDLWKAVETTAGPAEFKEVYETFSDASIDDNFEKLLTLCKLFLELHEDSKSALAIKISAFVKTAEATIQRRVDFVDHATDLTSHMAVVQKFGRRGIRKPRAKFFTTNYDLCYEEAARRLRFTPIDGFSHGLDQTYDRSNFDHDLVRRPASLSENTDYLDNVFHLYKLHGSIDWRRVDGDIVRSRGPSGEPTLIYPRSSKYQESFESPYLDMISSFQTTLREPDTGLIVSGFGFNDDHLGRPVLSAVESNMSLRLVLCDPAFLTDSDLTAGEHVISATTLVKNRFIKTLIELAAGGDPRIHILSGRFEDIALALPDLVGETDRERHASRIRALRIDPGSPS